MKKLLLALSTLACLYGCSSEMEFDTKSMDTAVLTNTAISDSVYYWESSDGNVMQDFLFKPKNPGGPIARTLNSYVQLGDTKTFLQPVIESKPSWVNYIVCFQYNEIYVLLVMPEENTSTQPRKGNVVLRQTQSNRKMTIGITQNGVDNRISVSVVKTYKNQYRFVANTLYPVEGRVLARVPFVVYNKGGEYTHDATIYIEKGESSGSYLMDWNASPLVAYHGDLDGYRLYEGSIQEEDDTYTYQFQRYW